MRKTMETKKDRTAVSEHFEIIMQTYEGKHLIRAVLHNGKVIYLERFESTTAWWMGGGNPVLDLFEKRFLVLPKEREDIGRYRCDIRDSGKGVRRVLSQLLNLQLKLLNRLLKHRFFGGKAPDP